MPRIKLTHSQKRERRRVYEAKYRKEHKEEMAARQRKYNSTDKGRARFKRFERTVKAKARTARYNYTDKAKARTARYVVTPKSKERYKRYRLNHPDRIRQTARRYRQNNPAKVRCLKKAWRDRNLNKCRRSEAASRARAKADPLRMLRKRITRAKWYNHKWKSDPLFRLKNNLRLRLRQAIKGKTKDQRALELLGCPLPVFKVYFESLFTTGMTWDGVFSGAVHIDHKFPIASFDLTKQEAVKKCFHFSNLQPLWAKDNILKSDSIPEPV